jgi:hypothetical protein
MPAIYVLSLVLGLWLLSVIVATWVKGGTEESFFRALRNRSWRRD